MLIIEQADTQPVFRHADGTLYGQPLRAESAEAFTKMFSALRHLGVREHEVQTVLVELHASHGGGSRARPRMPLVHALTRSCPRTRNNPAAKPKRSLIAAIGQWIASTAKRA